MRAFFSKKIIYHVIAWSLYIPYEVFVVVSRGAEGIFWEYAFFYILNISFFYINAHVVLKYITKTGKPWYLAILLMFLELLVYRSLAFGLGYWLHIVIRPDQPIDLTIGSLVGGIWRCIYILGLSTTYWLVLSLIEKNKRVNQLEIARIKAEKKKAELKNAYLLTQLNPYILFNTLGFVYDAVKHSPAASSVLLLADIMDHALSKRGEDGKIPLSAEIDHIRKIVELCQFRYNHEAHICLITKGEPLEKRILPLVLVTFVENVIKHGDLSDPEHPARIILTVQEEEVSLITSNRKKNTDISIGHRIGIRNARLRLAELSHENAARLFIKDDPDYYKVHLCIPA